MQITTDGLVVKQKNTGDKDRFITILTRDRGMISANAWSARGPRSSLAGSTELLTYANFVLFENKGRISVNSASVNDMFFELRRDVELLSLSTYLAQLCVEVLPEGEHDPQSLRLMLNCLHLLDQKKRTPDFIKPTCELRLLAMSGFMPDLVACRGCACYESENMYFLPTAGQICCSNCLSDQEKSGAMAVAPGVLSAMRYIVYSDFEKLFSFSLPKEGLRQLGIISQHYLLCQVHKQFPALGFYESVKMPLMPPENKI